MHFRSSLLGIFPGKSFFCSNKIKIIVLFLKKNEPLKPKLKTKFKCYPIEPFRGHRFFVFKQLTCILKALLFYYHLYVFNTVEI